MLLIGFIVPHNPQQSPVVPGSPPQSPAVLGSPLQSPVVPGSPLQSPTLKCLTLQGPPSSIRTAVRRFEGRVWTAFCRPVPSGALGSPPAGPCRGPGPLRTLPKTDGLDAWVNCTRLPPTHYRRTS